MKTELISAIVVAAAAVLGSIGSVLILAVRVGRLIGTVESHIVVSDHDRQRLWQEIGSLRQSQERHTEIFHGGARHVS